MSHGTARTPGAVGAPARRDGHQRMGVRRGGNGDVSGRRRAYVGFAGSGESPGGEDLSADMIAGPTRHRSVRTALRRRAWLWCATAVLGLAAGFGLFTEKPPGYQASASVLLGYSPEQNIALNSVTDLSLAQSRSLAEAALQQLGLREGLSSFIASYTVAATTDRVILFTVTAPSSDVAMIRANVLASDFLQFRATLLENQQRLVFAALDGQLADATPATRPGLQAGVANYRANAQVDTTSTVDGSKVLNVAAPIHRSLKKTVTDPGGGLLAGLALGMGFIIVQTIVSDRPRRRDDVARALRAPVRLSVGRIRLSRWRRGRYRLAAARRPEVRRIAEYLRGAVPPRRGRVAALAVVPVADSRVAVLSVLSLAHHCAQQGLKVVLADLCRGTPAARTLGVKAPGVHEAKVHDVPLVVAVPDDDDVAPVGPFDPRARSDPAAAPLIAACAAADLLLTVIDLDPAVGGEHLPGWAADAIVVVTAGRSSTAKIQVAGEMIRMAGLSLVSGVLAGADKRDDSLGMVPEPGIVPEPEADASLAGRS
jgi:capsular polysaccharide biosynthesis protein